MREVVRAPERTITGIECTRLCTLRVGGPSGSLIENRYRYPPVPDLPVGSPQGQPHGEWRAASALGSRHPHRQCIRCAASRFHLIP